MKLNAFLPLLATAVLLMGCASADRYPLSGQAVGANDQVQFMSAPQVTHY